MRRSFQDSLSQNGDGSIVIGKTAIPLNPENKNEIEAAIDSMMKKHKQEKKALAVDTTRGVIIPGT